MSSELKFEELIGRVRAGDSQAAAQLVRQFEPEIRRAIRLRLTDQRLRRVLDSMDICQSVFGQFFARVAVGQFDLHQPVDLIKLLVVMAQNRLKNHAGYLQAARRDVRRQAHDGPDLLSNVAGHSSSPSEIVQGEELLKKFREQLTDEEKFIADCRATGEDWSEIAGKISATAEATRKRFSRAISRIVHNLGLDEVAYE